MHWKIRALTVEDHDHDEQRFITLGMSFPLILVVVHVERHDDEIRIISARKATKMQTRQYYERLEQD